MKAVLDELPAAARVKAGGYVQDVDAEVAELRNLSTGLGAVVADLTSRMAKGGRRSVLVVMGHDSPKVRLLKSTRKALSKDLPNPKDYEIVAAASAVLSECGEGDAGLRDLQYRLAA